MRIRLCSLILCSLFILSIIILPCFSQKVDFEMGTRTYGGNVAPRNAAVIWIQTMDGKLINTVEVWSHRFNWCLYNWRRITGLDSTGEYDGMTSATRPGHDSPMKAAWDCKDSLGNLVPFDTYKFCAEMTEEEYWWKINDPNEEYLGKFTFGTIAIDGQTSTVAHGDTSDTAISLFKATYLPTASIKTVQFSKVKNSLWYRYDPGMNLISFHFPSNYSHPAILYIKNLRGETVINFNIEADTKIYYWDMQNDAHKRVSSGIYLYEIRDKVTGKRIGNTKSIALFR